MNDNIKTHHRPVASSLTENRIIAPIVFGVAILLGILITRPLYMSYIEDKARESTTQVQYENLEAEYEKLLEVKNNSGNILSEMDQKKIEKISRKFDRSDVLSTIMLSDHTKDTPSTSATIALGSVNLSEPVKLPNGLSLTNVGISLQGDTIDAIIDYITYLTSDTPYAFTIESISLPIDTAPEGEIPSGYALGLSLGIYSYE